MKTILVVGGTGAQGAAIVRILVSTGEYHILIFTRSSDSEQYKHLESLGNGKVEAVLSRAAQGYDLNAFETAARRSDGVFINTDGFSLGEKAEIYWGIRLFQASVAAGVRHIIYSGLDNNFRNSGYENKYYVGHYQGKAAVQDFIKAQPASSKTTWTIIRSGPYLELLAYTLLPTLDKQGNYSFQLPLNDGAIPFISLDDLGRYVHWGFSNLDKCAGLDLGIATAHVTGRDLADAFTEVTGKQATYNPVPGSEWLATKFRNLPNGPDTKIAFKSTEDQDVLGQTYGQNFMNFWNLYKASPDGSTGLVKRDYELLDRILPGRVKTVKEWMNRVGYNGERKIVLKDNAVSE